MNPHEVPFRLPDHGVKHPRFHLFNVRPATGERPLEHTGITQKGARAAHKDGVWRQSRTLLGGTIAAAFRPPEGEGLSGLSFELFSLGPEASSYGKPVESA